MQGEGSEQSSDMTTGIIINVQQLEKRYKLGRQRVYAPRGTSLSDYNPLKDI